MPAAEAAPAAPRPVLDRTEHLAPSTPAAPGRVLASPYVRKAAREMGVDLSSAQYRMLVQLARGTEASSALAEKLAVTLG